MNKWLRNRLGEGNVIHGFRHSMRDRLRAVECPSDLIDQIGGWVRGSIGEGYGKGYSLDIKQRWIKKLFKNSNQILNFKIYFSIFGMLKVTLK